MRNPIHRTMYVNNTYHNYATIDKIYMRPYYNAELEIAYRLSLYDSDDEIYYLMCYENFADAYNSLMMFGYEDADVEVIKEEI